MIVSKTERTYIKKTQVWWSKKDGPQEKYDVVLFTTWCVLVFIPVFYSSRVLSSYYDGGFLQSLIERDGHFFTTSEIGERTHVRKTH